MAEDHNDTFDDNPFRQRGVVQEGYSVKRGKVTPQAKAAWGVKGGMGQDVGDGTKILDEALR